MCHIPVTIATNILCGDMLLVAMLQPQKLK